MSTREQSTISCDFNREKTVGVGNSPRSGVSQADTRTRAADTYAVLHMPRKESMPA